MAVLRPADRAWLALAAGVAAWDTWGHETLSTAVDRYHHAWPWVTRAVVAYFAAHLLGIIPGKLDPLHALTRLRHSPKESPWLN
ncbi:MAG: hypothetical protein E6R06_32965 [Mycobacterium sp.]|nr:MAG: hypothetical protein E6R06_32965 [Mycobacterium sp.]